jgi:hypothetical protein
VCVSCPLMLFSGRDISSRTFRRKRPCINVISGRSPRCPARKAPCLTSLPRGNGGLGDAALPICLASRGLISGQPAAKTAASECGPVAARRGRPLGIDPRRQGQISELPAEKAPLPYEYASLEWPARRSGPGNLPRTDRTQLPPKRGCLICVQIRDYLGVAHVGPFSFDFDCLHLPAFLGCRANRVRQFIFASW